MKKATTIDEQIAKLKGKCYLKMTLFTEKCHFKMTLLGVFCHFEMTFFGF